MAFPQYRFRLGWLAIAVLSGTAVFWVGWPVEEVSAQEAGVGAAQTESAETQTAAKKPAEREESWLLREPKTPEALFDTVILMVEFAKLDLAREYLHRLVEQKPDDAALLRMRAKHGPTAFFRLSKIPELQPDAIRLLERMNEAFRKAATDPARLDRLIAKLAGSAAEREEAIIELRSVAPLAVARIMHALRQRAHQAHRDVFVATMVRFGRLAIPPLLGVLESDQPELKSVAIDVLGWIGDRDVVPYLWYAAFGVDEEPTVRKAAREALSRLLFGRPDRVDQISAFGAVDELLGIAERHFRNEYRWPLDDDGRTLIWVWDGASGTVRSVRVSPREASWRAGSRFAAEALRLASDNLRAQALYLAFQLVQAAERAGWGNPLPTGPGTAYELALRAGPDVVATALQTALRDANPACAIAALQVLGQIGPRHQLYQSRADEAPLLVALNYPDPRVQFAAASAVLELDPDKPFRGAARVVNVLQRTLADQGLPHGLTIDPNTQRSATIAGIVRELGYEPLIAATGREGFQIAASRSDVELILIHENSVRWELSLTVANLRADVRTASIPIAIYGPDPTAARIQRLLQQYPLVTYVVETTSSRDLKGQLRPFLSRLGAPPLTRQQRNRLREAAAFWFAHLANGRRTEIFDIAPAEAVLRRAILEPELAHSALVALGSIATASAQKSLLEAALNENLAGENRVTAALQLGFHIQRFGFLMSPADVERLRAAWDRATEAEMRTALSAVIGVLRPNAAQVGRRLLEFEATRLASPPKP